MRDMRNDAPRAVTNAFSIYVCGTLLFWLGVGLGYSFVAAREQGATLNSVLGRFDATSYSGLVDHGYRYSPHAQSSVAFFPAFPAAGWLASRLSGVPTMWALMAVANIAAVLAILLFVRYASDRCEPIFGTRSRWFCSSAGQFAALLFACWPTAIFMHLAYSESLFLAITLAAMLGMKRRWPALLVALLVGLATATRPVGVALLVPFAYDLRRRSNGLTGWCGRAAVYLPVACWGLIAYSVYQQIAFGDALAFAKTQDHWRMRETHSRGDQLLCLASLEPIWSVYDPTSRGYWLLPKVRSPVPILNLQFMNPIFYLGAVLTVVFGGVMRWLSREELLLSAGLLLIPYITRSYEMCMNSQGRFALVVFPVYLVLGRLLAQAPPLFATAAICLSGALMTAYAAMFAGGYLFY